MLEEPFSSGASICHLILPNLFSMLSVQPRKLFHMSMAAIQITESVCGLIITVYSIHLKPNNR